MLINNHLIFKFIVLNIVFNTRLDTLFIKGTSHCVDMYANQPDDPEELVAARLRIGELIDKWIKEETNPN